MRILCVKLPEEMFEILDALRATTGLERSVLVREAINEMLLSLAYDHKLRQKLLAVSRNPMLTERVLDDLLGSAIHKIRKWGVWTESMDQ